MKVKVTPEHRACLEEVKQLVIKHSATIPVDELQAILSQVIGYLVPLGQLSIEQIDELVAQNIAVGVVAGCQAMGEMK